MRRPIKRVGEWNKVRRICQRLGRTVQTEAGRDLVDATTWGESKAVKFLRDQSLSWTPLNPDYVNQKVKRGESSKTLIASSQYLQSITSHVDYPRAWVGVKRRAFNKEGQAVADIARVHEFGSVGRGIPARPLWRPVQQRLKYWFKKRSTERRIINELKKM